MPGPFSEQQQQELKEKAQEFLLQFSKEYAKMFGLAFFNKIKDEVEGAGGDPRKLTYRNWDDIERPTLFHGYAYMKTGEGVGAFGKWKKYFFVERQDYNIDYFKDEKDIEKNKKPAGTIQICGYNLEENPSHFYRNEMEKLKREMGYTGDDGVPMYSHYAWALTHPVRINYIFQLHKGSDPFCPCLGGNVVEPDELGSEFAGDREKWVSVFGNCAKRCSARDTDCIKGRAFEMTCGKLTGKFSSLHDWSDNGTEAQMLVDMLVEHCLSSLQTDILTELKGPLGLRTMAWYKTRGVIVVTLQKMVDPTWAQVQKAADATAEKIEPVIRTGLTPILKVKEDIKDKIKEKVTDKLGEALAKYVSPFLEKIFKIFDQPLTDGFSKGQEEFQNNAGAIIAKGLPADEKQVCLMLDAVPRDVAVMSEMCQKADDVIQALVALKGASGDVFDDLDPVEHRDHAEQLLLTTMDAAVYTLELKIKADGAANANTYMDDIMKNYAEDSIIGRSMFMSETIKCILIAAFKKALSPVVGPLLDAFNDLVPEDVQDFLSIEGLYDEIVDLFVGEPIIKMVEGAYPVPKKEIQQEQV